MTWVAAGVAAAGAIKGGMDARQARKDQAAHNKFRKASIRFSPWSGMGDPGAGNFGNQDMLGGAIGGGLQGYAMGSSLKGLGASGAASGGQGNMMALNYNKSKSPYEGLA